VVAVGGDGTVNEVVNGLLDDTGPARAALGVIATGRGRDVCRNLGLPSGASDAARRVAEGTEVRVDLGIVEWSDGRRRYFVNAAGAGFDATVARRSQSGGGGSGTIPYVWAVLGALRAHRPVAATLYRDGALAWSGRLTAAVVANGPHYGGGMKIAPAADPADGVLDLIILGDLGRLELLRWLPTVYRGAHLAHPAITADRGRTILVRTSPPVPIHTDGEDAGQTPIRVGIRPGALRLRR
jgi:YegS/Rv2252/BmrU family lipid kinase